MIPEMTASNSCPMAKVAWHGISPQQQATRADKTGHHADRKGSGLVLVVTYSAPHDLRRGLRSVAEMSMRTARLLNQTRQ